MERSGAGVRRKFVELVGFIWGVGEVVGCAGGEGEGVEACSATPTEGSLWRLHIPVRERECVCVSVYMRS